MLIDWFTVAAQVLNFLVLVWLLKHFLYRPILKAIDAREKLIAEKLAGAEAKMADAGKERDDFQHKNDELDQRRAALISEMEAATATERARLLDEAKKAADALAVKRQAATKADVQKMNLAIGQRIQHQVLAVARQALKDLSTVDLEQSIGDKFLHQVRELDEAGKQRLQAALTTAAEPAKVRSAFELSGEQRAAMQQALNETLSADIRINYEVAPDLISGIEFITNGQKISWSIADYVTSLEDSVGDLLQKQVAQSRLAAADKPNPAAEPRETTGESPAKSNLPAKGDNVGGKDGAQDDAQDDDTTKPVEGAAAHGS